MRCVSHASVDASRQCSRCQRAWCGACIKQLTVASKLLEICQRCGGPLREPYQQAAARAFSVGELIARPFTSDGIITAAAVASPMLLASLVAWIPGMGWFVGLMSLVYYGTLVGYYFAIISHVGEDKDGLPGPSELTDTGALSAMARRGWLCVLVGALPYLVWFYLVRDSGTPPSPVMMALTVLIGLTYMPAALVCVVVTGTTLGALYPVLWFKVIGRAPKSYLQLVGLFIAAMLAFALFRLVGERLGRIPVVGDYATTVGLTLLWMAQAALVGGFLRRHAEEFGYA